MIIVWNIKIVFVLLIFFINLFCVIIVVVDEGKVIGFLIGEGCISEVR